MPTYGVGSSSFEFLRCHSSLLRRSFIAFSYILRSRSAMLMFSRFLLLHNTTISAYYFARSVGPEFCFAVLVRIRFWKSNRFITRSSFDYPAPMSLDRFPPYYYFTIKPRAPPTRRGLFSRLLLLVSLIEVRSAPRARAVKTFNRIAVYTATLPSIGFALRCIGRRW
jgi:hypothetical protein